MKFSHSLLLLIILIGCKPNNKEIVHKHIQGINEGNWDLIDQTLDSNFVFLDYTHYNYEKKTGDTGYGLSGYHNLVREKILLNGKISYDEESILELGDTLCLILNYKDDLSKYLGVEHPPVRQIYLLPNGSIYTIAADTAIGYRKAEALFNEKLEKFKNWYKIKYPDMPYPNTDPIKLRNYLEEYYYENKNMKLCKN